MHFSKIMIICHLNFGNQTPHLYLHAIHIVHCFTIAGFTSMILFFKVLHFCFQLVYQTVFILDECYGLVNLPHQFHSKLNMALIFKLYHWKTEKSSWKDRVWLWAPCWSLDRIVVESWWGQSTHQVERRFEKPTENKSVGSWRKKHRSESNFAKKCKIWTVWR